MGTGAALAVGVAAGAGEASGTGTGSAETAGGGALGTDAGAGGVAGAPRPPLSMPIKSCAVIAGAFFIICSRLVSARGTAPTDGGVAAFAAGLGVTS